MSTSLPQPIHRKTLVLPRPVRPVAPGAAVRPVEASEVKVSKKRAKRSDSGSVRVSEEYVELFRYIAGCRYVNITHIAKWLGRSEVNTKRQIRKWVAAGLVEVIQMRPSYWAIYLTPKAHRSYLPELEIQPVSRPANDKSFAHDFALATVTQMALLGGERYFGERVLRVVYEREISRRLYVLRKVANVNVFDGNFAPDLQAARTPEGVEGNEHAYVLHDGRVGKEHVPDAVLITPTRVIAVEVERHQKQAGELARIARHFAQSELYDEVRYYIPETKPAVRRQVEAQALHWGGELHKYRFEHYNEEHWAAVPSRLVVRAE